MSGWLIPGFFSSTFFSSVSTFYQWGRLENDDDNHADDVSPKWANLGWLGGCNEREERRGEEAENASQS